MGKLKPDYEVMTDKLSQEVRELRGELKEKDRLLDDGKNERKVAEQKEQQNEMNKEKGTSGGNVTYTEEQMKAIVQHAMGVAAEKTAEKCKNDGAKNIVEYEYRLAKLREESEAAEKRWNDKVKAM